MKRPTAASLKKVNAENLAGLGAGRLAEILADVAAARPELKRRLRMELAAEQGSEHLAVEIDKRLGSLETSRSKVSWRQRPTFVRDLEALRALIAGRLAELGRPAALQRLWLFMDVARRVGGRVKDKDGVLAAVFARAAANLGTLAGGLDEGRAADALVDAMVRYPPGWAEWLPTFLENAPPGVSTAALQRISERPSPMPAWIPLIRRLADAAGDPDAYRATFSDKALADPSLAAEVAGRLLAADRIAEAGKLLKAAGPEAKDGFGFRSSRPAEPDFEWETAWIDYLDRSGQAEAAQSARWASFERTLSADRLRAFTRRLTDFQDVEAETRAFEHALAHPDLQRGLKFLMDWPALPEAARLIQARPEDVDVTPAQADTWAAKLRLRQPQAAHILLRKAAAAAFRRRDFATCDRLTQEADAIGA